MNNLFDFDNLASMRGNKLTTSVSGGTVTETIRDTVTDIANAVRVTTFTSDRVAEQTTIYDDNGTTILRRTTVTTTFGPDGGIEEVVS
jgi:hypothetical protein